MLVLSLWRLIVIVLVRVLVIVLVLVLAKGIATISGSPPSSNVL